MNEKPTDRQRQGGPRIPLSVLKAIQEIVDYCWNDEFIDYSSREKEDRDGHVFRDLLIVRRYLTRIGVVDE
jgi:hypothetical protein